ncbi:MAG TPA: hypothetical protein VFR37_20685 [Longimicrobium sp.]|nr:hypothetical protein [Longimicrobium sp.]
MRMRISALLLPLAAAGCIWLPLGSDAVPRVGLQEVQRSSGAGAAWTARPGPEPDGRGTFFEDSLIAFRTQATVEGVRFRLWNKGDALLRIEWDAAAVGKAAGRCPADAAGWEMRRRGGGAPADVVPPRASREDEAVAVARVPTLQGGLWTSVPLDCLAGDPGAGRAPLRLTVAVGDARYAYTFWYGAGTPRADADAAAGTAGEDAGAPLRP